MTNVPTLADEGELEPAVRRATAWLDQNGLGVFWGELESEEGLPDATWDVRLVPEVESFLVLAKASGTKLVFLDLTICSIDELRKKAKGDSSPDLERLAALVEPHAGEVAEIGLSWLGGGVLHRFTLGATWANDYFAAWELAESQSEEDDEGMDDVPDEEEVRRHADVLARDSKFQSARSAAPRAYAARKVLDGSVVADKQLFEAVLQEAKNIFEIEIKPDMDKRLADEVQGLKDQGLTKAQIAQRLGISANKMKTMF